MTDVLHKLIRSGLVKEALDYISNSHYLVTLLKDKHGYKASTLARARGYMEIVEAIEKKCNKVTGDDLMPSEFNDISRVLEMGAKKYGAHDWEKEEGAVINHKNNHESMFRHLAESSSGVTQDKESGLHPLLHLATRALMGYTRHVRGLK